MSDWAVILAPLALAAAVFLLAPFVGCALDRSGLLPTDSISPPAPDYGALILGEPQLVAYWRLGEPAGTGATDPAADATGAHPGTYRTADLAAGAQSPETAHPPVLSAGQDPLVPTAVGQTSVRVNGGYVRVPFAAALNPPKVPGFSVEAWAHPEWDAGETGVFRCVTASREDTGMAKHGYIIYAGPQLDPVTFAVVDPAMRWQAWVGDGATWKMLLGPPVQLALTTYLLITYDGATEAFQFDAVNDATDLQTYAPATMTASYSPSPAAGARPLYIGMGAPELPVPRFPFRGRLQDVAVYSAPLTGAQFTAHLQAATGI